MAGGPSVPTQALYNAVGIYNGPIPQEGPKTVPIGLNFAAQNTYVIDFTMLQQRGFISELQAVFIDNADNGVSFTLTVNGTNQRIVCPPGVQGIFPIFAPNPPRFTAQTTGGVSVGLQFLNVPITCLTWDSAGGTFTFSSGALNVSDAILDAQVGASGLNVAPNENYSGDVPRTAFVGNAIFSSNKSTVGQATIIAGAPNWYVTFIEIQLSPDATQAAAGEFPITLNDSATGTVVASAIATVPNSPPTFTAAAAPLILTRMDNMTYSSFQAGNLTITLANALTAGKVTWNVVGGVTAKT